MAPMKPPVEHEQLPELDETYSLTHLAHRWGVSRKTIRRLLQEGELPFVEVDGQLRIPAISVHKVEEYSETHDV